MHVYLAALNYIATLGSADLLNVFYIQPLVFAVNKNRSMFHVLESSKVLELGM